MKRITMLLAFLVALSWQGMAQTSTLYLTTSGGSYASEKWVEITTGANGTGTVIWAQGSGVYGNGAGYVTDSSFTVTNGTNYYISTYDAYADGWDGTTYAIRTAAGGGGTVVANNGGVSPDDLTDADATGSFETRAVERESDELFSYTPASCLAPSLGVVANLSATSADLGWTENGTATAWDIEWDTAGFTATGTPTITGTTTNPHSLTGLTAATAYEFYVRSSCSAIDSSAWVGPFSFTTACNAVTSFPYTENFDGAVSNGVWNCWTVINNDNDSYTWSQSNTYISPTHSGSYAAHGMGNNDDYLITPQLAVGATAIRVKFWDKVESSSYLNTYTVRVSITGTNPADFTDSITTINCLNTSWIEHIVDLSAYTNQSIYVAFHQTYSAATYYGFGIDDFTAEEIPNCLAPTAQTANVTATTADLGWTENGTATTWDIEWDTAGFTASGTPTITGATTNPHSLTGLAANTSYEFYVRADCGGNSSTWVGPFSFTTACNAVSSFPYTEDFDGSLSNNVWSCWTVNNVDGGNTWSQSNTYISPTHSGSYAAHGMGNNDDYLITPQLAVGATAIRVKFWDKVESSSYLNTYTVRVSITGTNPADFTDSITTINCLNTSWIEHIVDLSAYTNQSIYVAFHQTYSAATYYGFGIDDFTAEEIPTCPAPDSLAVGNVGANSVDLSWVETGSATAWEVEYDTTNFTLGSGTNTSALNPQTISGLSAVTSYDYYVRAVCGVNDSSVWVGPFAFTSGPDTITVPYLNDFETGATGTDILLTSAIYSNATVDTAANNASTYGVLLTGLSSTGWTGGSTSATETNAWVDNAGHVSSIDMVVDASGLTGLALDFDLKQTYSYGSKYSWGRVVVNGVQLGSSVNPSTGGADPFTTINVDLSAYAGTVFTLSLQHSGKYNKANGSGGNGDEAFVDNVKLYVPVSTSTTATNVSCNSGTDGTANVTVGTGTSPYSYVWSNGDTTAMADTLGAGSYYVTVTDANGSESIDTAMVTEPAMLVATVVADSNASCFGMSDGGASVSAVGGTTPYTFVWDNTATTASITGLMAGTYYVTVTDSNSCATNDSVMITEPVMVTVDLGNDTSVCNGASLTIDAGTGYASYTWSDNSTMQTLAVPTATAGSMDYSVEVADANGCAANDTVNVTVFAAVTTSITGGTDLCAYETATLDAGAGFATYVWNTTETMQTINVDAATLGTGVQTFMVTVTDANGCSGDATTSFDVFAPVMVDLGDDTSIIWFGADTSYVVDAGAGFVTYLWHDATTAQSNMITLSNMGNVSVVVEDGNGCLGTDTVVVDFILGVPTLEVSSIKMYPNPAVDQLNIEISNFNNVKEFNVTILNVIGEVVYSEQLNASGNSYKGLVDVSSLATGTYFVQFEANGQREVRQFIIK